MADACVSVTCSSISEKPNLRARSTNSIAMSRAMLRRCHLGFHMEFAQFGRSRSLRSKATYSHHFVPSDGNEKVAAGFAPGGYFFGEAAMKGQILNEPVRIASDGAVI
jgi:hypothetical protein